MMDVITGCFFVLYGLNSRLLQLWKSGYPGVIIGLIRAFDFSLIFLRFQRTTLQSGLPGQKVWLKLR